VSKVYITAYKEPFYKGGRVRLAAAAPPPGR
jgi:hypothetical protein